jgi:hypothetical protein
MAEWERWVEGFNRRAMATPLARHNIQKSSLTSMRYMGRTHRLSNSGYLTKAAGERSHVKHELFRLVGVEASLAESFQGSGSCQQWYKCVTDSSSAQYD